MRDHSDVDKEEKIKKYCYSGPKKIQPLPEQWSGNVDTNESYLFGKPASGFNLDRVWSIKKNVSVDQKAGEGLRYGFLNPKRAKVVGSNSFYSRHQTISANPSTSNSDCEVDSSVNFVEKPWQHHSATIHSSRPTGSSLDLPSNDEFVFDLTISNSIKRYSNGPNKKCKSFDNYSDAPVKTDQVSDSMTKENQTNSLRNMSPSYGSKYNSSFFGL